MDSTRFQQLTSLVYSQQASESERDEWLNMLHSGQYEQAFQQWADEQGEAIDFDQPVFTAEQKNAQLRRILASEDRPQRFVFFRNVNKLAAACAAIAVLGAVIWLSVADFMPFNERSAEDEQAIAPGTNKASIILPNGKILELNSEKQGIVLGKTLAYDDGTAIHLPDLLEDGHTSTEPSKIVVPKGGQYAITLSDGTKVWLNAATTLIYPTYFEPGKPRIVELEGEAFFEVQNVTGAKSQQTGTGTQVEGEADHSFWVVSKSHKVQVLGTQFNIQSYPEDPSIRTTLVEGSVRIDADGQQLTLKPGEQSMHSDNQLSKRQVDLSSFTAWRNGMFAFDGDDIHQVMHKLARWYDVEVQFENNLTEDTFGGTISRFESITEVLALLERTGKVRFQVEGRRVTVMN